MSWERLEPTVDWFVVMPYVESNVIVIEPALINTPLWDRDIEGRIEQYRGSMFYEANRKKLEHEAAEAIYQALIIPKPKPRYLVTNHPVQHRLVRFLPDALLDRLVAKEF